MAFSFGLLLDVDWSSLFKSFYEKIRIKVAYRNPRKIPVNFEMDKKLYLITIMVEGFEQEGSTKFDDLDDADDLDDEDENGDGKKDAQERNDVDQTHQSMETVDIGFSKFSTP
jgi:hypothetical protein